MKNNCNFTSKIYDPALYLALQPIRKAVMNELKEHKNKSILDLCCGTGNQLKLLSRNGFKNLHCLDLSDSMLEIAKKNSHFIKIYNEDAVKTNFKDSSFDIIIISFAIHEKDRNIQEKLINEAFRIIKKDGLLLIVDYAFDNKTIKIGRIGINIVEKMAGKEHYGNFKNYIQNNGLLSLIKKDRFKLIKSNKKLFNGVTISTYQKILKN